MDYKSLAKTYGTPLYIYDFNKIENNYLSLKNAFKARKSLICYAVKANSNLSILSHLASLGAGFDCVSFNEVKRALKAGASAYKIIFSGVGKSDFELEEALRSDILMINLESRAEMIRLENIAKSLNKTARISIRVNPNIDAKTHHYISTGLWDNKFGVSIDEARKMYLYAKNSSNLTPVGIHFHIGSQLSDVAPLIESAKIIAKLTKELIALDIDIKFFDVGGGIGIDYQGENTINLYDYAQGILASLQGIDATIVCEPGRFIVGKSGELLVKVLYEKSNEKKRFIITDGAMNDLLRPSLYNAYHDVVSLKNGETSLCDVVGPVCESGDFLAKNISLPAQNSGDLLVVKDVGAYGFSMSSNYNSRQRAAEVGVLNGEVRLIRRRESFEDLIKFEEI